MSAIPAKVAVMSWIFLKEQIGPRIWAAVACGALGIGLLSLAQAGATPGLPEAGAQQELAWLGNILIFGAVLCEGARSEEHTSELQSLMRTSYAVFCLKKTNKNKTLNHPQR